NKQLIVLNAVDGKVVDKLPIGEGCDGVAFDKTTGNIFASNGEGTLSVYHQKNANQFEKVDIITTKRGARTITVDEETHKVYVPTAEFEPQPANDKQRPKMKAGTFQVLVIGQ
ncbi:MAG: YncE family protein, partial [Bacteroidota bacterium]